MTDHRRLASDASAIPPIGFGTYSLKHAAGAESIASAIRMGYRLIDSAAGYENEDAVGDGIRQSGTARDELWVTTKLPGDVAGGAATIASFRASLDRLALERVDLYLIHWPNPDSSAFVESWRAMIDLRAEGLIGDIGVSNFTEPMIELLEAETGVLPVLDQIEVHPYFPQATIRGWLGDAGIRVEAWSPLGNYPPVLQEPIILGVARKYDVTPAQAVLRWHVELGTIPIPKSGSMERQRENLDIFGFALTADEVDQIASLAIDGWDRFDYFDPRRP